MTVGGAAGAVCGSGGAAAGAAMLCPCPCSSCGRGAWVDLLLRHVEPGGAERAGGACLPGRVPRRGGGGAHLLQRDEVGACCGVHRRRVVLARRGQEHIHPGLAVAGQLQQQTGGGRERLLKTNARLLTSRRADGPRDIGAAAGAVRQRAKRLCSSAPRHPGRWS